MTIASEGIIETFSLLEKLFPLIIEYYFWLHLAVDHGQGRILHVVVLNLILTVFSNKYFNSVYCLFQFDNIVLIYFLLHKPFCSFSSAPVLFKAKDFLLFQKFVC